MPLQEYSILTHRFQAAGKIEPESIAPSCSGKRAAWENSAFIIVITGDVALDAIVCKKETAKIEIANAACFS